jgi:hypothetical protein
MAIPTTPPDRESYKHVLIRTDKDASKERGLPIRVACYHENATSRSILWHGCRVHMVFLRHQESATRAWRLGWQIITDEWFSQLERDTPQPTTPSQESILNVLDSEWRTKKEIIAQSGIRDSEWRTAIRYLLDKGLAETNANRHTSNRSYLYKRGEG